MKLLLDIGNSRLKWCAREGDQRLASGACLINELARLEAAWQELPKPERIFGACVADAALQAEVARLAHEYWGMTPEWLVVGETAPGLRNGYRPEQLGVDRWAALVAARRHASGNLVVVSAGTAITVDAVTANGDYLGGCILPGLTLMRRALFEHTARLPMAEGRVQDFPQQTIDAIQTGVVDAACGAIERLCRRLEARGRQRPQILLAGGDAPRLAEWMPQPCQVVDGLVLEGLHLLSS